MKELRLNSSMVITAIAILCICLFLFDKCNSKPEIVTYNGTDSLKQLIVEHTKIKDSLLVEVKKKDTLRVEVIKRYRTIIHDTTLVQICATIIKACDSIIVVDSSLITDLKNIIKVDSVIIGNYKKVAETDSNKIVQLTKEVKKHKRHKRWLVGGIIATGVIAILK
jgi:hypothetical protein